MRIPVKWPAGGVAAKFIRQARCSEARLGTAAMWTLPAYREFALSHTDGDCGAAMLAETSVAVPFVSAVAGALAVTQAIRVASGQAHHIGIAGDISVTSGVSEPAWGEA